MDVIEMHIYGEDDDGEPVVLKNGESVEGTWTVTWNEDGIFRVEP